MFWTFVVLAVLMVAGIVWVATRPVDPNRPKSWLALFWEKFRANQDTTNSD